ncbi:MAG: hypothetical protein H0U10_12180 [Chloroflexia bacterium]|nr:hypothetical protein [Chloroflexia bacterium]
MSKLKTYLAAILFSIGFVLVSPLFLLVIFLSGDSCCGENTSLTMIAVTAGVVILLSGVAVLLNGTVKLGFKRDTPEFSVVVASLLTAAPASVICIGFVTYVIVTGF